MKKVLLFIKKYWVLIAGMVISFILFFRSLFAFYTNDDFFHLKIANIHSIKEFINFFSLTNPPQGWSFYRPLTTQVYYLIGERVFNFKPLSLHIVSFLFFFGIIILIYRICLSLLLKQLGARQSKNIALVSAFLYAVSASHFGHLYFLGAFQELGMTFFVLMTCLMFIKKRNLSAFIFFVLALASKETAVVTPLLLALIYLYERVAGIKVSSFKRFLVTLAPYVVLLAVYLTLRFVSFGFATGDSYVWDFGIKKMVNTLFWYLLWSFNLPETLVDFFGPGLKINPNLFIYWSKEFILIFSFFALELIMLAGFLIKQLKRGEGNHENAYVSLFSGLWFLITILPVAFLPLHKFTYYLTLPLIGVVIRISYLIVKNNVKTVFVVMFMAVWTLTSYFSLVHTYNVSWITQGMKVGKKVYAYFETNKNKLTDKKIVFVDTPEDTTLPWSPTDTLKTVLSGNNFFDVFYADLSAKVSYAGLIRTTGSQDVVFVVARQFLGY